MDNWTVIVGGVAVGLVALYFNPTIDNYIKTLTQDEQYRIHRLKAKNSQGLFQLLDKFDIQEYVMKHPSMSQVANLLKTCGNQQFSSNSNSNTTNTSTSPGTGSPTTPGISFSPRVPQGSGISSPGSTPGSPLSDSLGVNTKFLPTQLQFDLFIADLVTFLVQRDEFIHGNFGSIDGMRLNTTTESLQTNFTTTTPTKITMTTTTMPTMPTTTTTTTTTEVATTTTPASLLPQLLSQALSTSISNHQALNLAFNIDTIEQLHKLYLLALQSDSHPDYKLQAYYDLYTTSTAIGHTDHCPSTPKNKVMTNDPDTSPGMPKEETITWTPASGPRNPPNGIDSEDLSTLSLRGGNTRPTGNHGIDQRNSSYSSQYDSLPGVTNNNINGLSVIVPQSDKDTPNYQLNGTGTDDYGKEITYPSVYNGLQELYEISTFSVLLESLRKVKVEHTVQWHERCLETLWNLAPIYPSEKDLARKKNDNAAAPASHESPTLEQQQQQQQQQHVPYQQLTERWGDIGFQGRDPCTDFRGCGLLGLISLVSFAIQYPEDYNQYIEAQQIRGIGIYGLAITSINITATLVTYTQNHTLAPIYLHEGATFSTFIKLHAYVLRLLWVEWNKRTDKLNFGMALSNEQKHRSMSSSFSSPSQSPIPSMQRGITIMDFPHIFKEVLVLFRKQIYQGQVELL